MHPGVLELRVERIGIDVDAIAELLIAEAHHEWHDVDAECLCVRWGDVGCAVGDEMDHLTRGRARTDSAPDPRRAARTRFPDGCCAGLRPAPRRRRRSRPRRGTR